MAVLTLLRVETKPLQLTPASLLAAKIKRQIHQLSLVLSNKFQVKHLASVIVDHSGGEALGLGAKRPRYRHPERGFSSRRGASRSPAAERFAGWIRDIGLEKGMFLLLRLATSRESF